jgi:hypothetical protein
MKKVTNICFVLALVCLTIAVISLIPTGESSWGGFFWIGAHLFVALGLVSIIVKL